MIFEKAIPYSKTPHGKAIHFQPYHLPKTKPPGGPEKVRSQRGGCGG